MEAIIQQEEDRIIDTIIEDHLVVNKTVIGYPITEHLAQLKKLII